MITQFNNTTRESIQPSNCKRFFLFTIVGVQNIVKKTDAFLPFFPKRQKTPFTRLVPSLTKPVFFYTTKKQTMPSASKTFVRLVEEGLLGTEERLTRLEEFFTAHPSYLDPDEEAPIATAVHHRCSVEVLQYLIGKGCGGVDKKMMDMETTREGKTPLCIAIQSGRTDFVDVLLQTGANYAKKSGQFRTPPIVYAVQNKKRETTILRHLLRHDPQQVDWTDCNGVTALRSAAKYGNVDAVRILLSCGANPTLADKKGFTALDMCRSGAFFPFLFFQDIDTIIATNRRQIAHLLEEEDRAFLVYKGYAIEDGLLARREFQGELFSILHLPEVLKKRVFYHKAFPQILYTAQGYQTRPGGDVVKMDPTTVVQEVLYEIWTTMKRDVFKELMGFLAL